MFTLVGYTESQDTSGNLTYVAALADQHVRVEADNIVVPAGMANLLGACALGATLSRAQVETPSMRRTLLLDLAGLNIGAEPVFPLAYHQGFYNPIPLDEFEPMRALVAETAEGAEREFVLVWLGDGPQAPVTGDIYTVRATSTQTLVANTWTNGALTLAQTLPSGRYQVVGFHAVSAGLIAARLVFVGGTWRPGVIGADSQADGIPDLFRRGALGVWGEFAHDQPPTVDFLSVSADEAETVHLDLIKVA